MDAARLQRKANHRIGHVSVQYRNQIIIWGGYNNNKSGNATEVNSYFKPNEVRKLFPLSD